MIIDPIRYLRRRRRLVQEAEEEAAYLRRRFGPDAHQAALEKLQRADLTSWGKRVVSEAARRLEGT
ncbi:MAG: hypothetical protein A2882_01565 [Phenylobacterium sp. RIFCSPHIGHO2_01_FULL_70_10]|nr:MAG: hypothetical protein A2882_01565 [Phenylobacterium sp. RIFCSPHIGHO2_01_FULL_70_10]